MVLLALGAAFWSLLSGVPPIESTAIAAPTASCYDRGYGAGYPGGYIDGTLAPYGRVYRDEERRRDSAQHRRDEPDRRGTTRPDRDRYTAPGSQYQRPYGPDRDPDDERFAPGGRP